MERKCWEVRGFLRVKFFHIYNCLHTVITIVTGYMFPYFKLVYFIERYIPLQFTGIEEPKTVSRGVHFAGGGFMPCADDDEDLCDQGGSGDGPADPGKFNSHTDPDGSKYCIQYITLIYH